VVVSGLRVYRSNRLEVLVIALAEQLRVPAGDPLRPVEVVVGSRGMERHLRHALAEQLGVCAHVLFPFPNAALDALVVGARGEQDPWSPGALTWALLEVLPAVAGAQDAGPLRRYLGAMPGAGPVDARTWGLARRIADAFDGYITYRPDVVAAWSEGRIEGLPEAQRWQAALWRAVQDHLESVPHRAERLATLAELPPDSTPLAVFGLAGLAGSWLAALGKVSQSRPVDLYLLCPSDQYWADLGRRMARDTSLAGWSRDEVTERLRASPDRDSLGDGGHPLLISWGRTGRDLQILLQTLPDGFEDRRTDLFIDPRGGEAPDTALRVLQADIVRAVHPAMQEDFPERRLDPGDRSLQFHICHGPTRQVEVLRTALLEILDREPELRPRDIVVMTPDIDSYAPLIGAVFNEGQLAPGRDGWGPAGSPRLPWELADLAVRRLNPVADALLRVLELVEGRASASVVLDLLSLEPVGERFAISAEDLVLVRSWVVESGVRWAEGASQRAALGQPDDAQNTWQFGLERILLGVVMADDGRLPAGVRPFDTAEGGATRLVGRLAAFCGTLFEQIDRLRSPRPLAGWVEQLAVSVDALTATSGLSAWLTRRVRQEIEALGREVQTSHSAVDIDVSAIRASLARRFEVASSAHHGSGGAITFCGMVPERAVPYRVVCLLGMDDGSFPRTTARAAFDLLQHTSRIGDRDARDEDRYLLLEAVLSARSHLIVLYTGRDVRTNEVRPPAVPVSELADAIDATWPDDGGPSPRARLTREHPLQAFDTRDFEADPTPWSYDARLLQGVRASAGRRVEATAFLSSDLAAPSQEVSTEELPIEALVHFWRHPLRAFLQRELGIYLSRDDTEDVPDREPLELGWLDHNLLLQEVLIARSTEVDPETIREAMRASGTLPLGGAGQVAFDTILALAQQMETCASETVGWRRGASMDLDLDVAMDSLRLVGRLDGLGERALVGFRYGTERGTDLLETWLRLLAWRATHPSCPGRALLVFGRIDSLGQPAVDHVGLEIDEDAGLLTGLVRLWREGHERPLPFLPRTSHALAKSLCSGRNALPGDWLDPDRLEAGAFDGPVVEALATALASAQSKWVGGFSKGEAEDRYNQHAFGSTLPFLGPEGAVRPEFVSLAVRVWRPVLAARRTPAKLRGWGAP
jgi:exodeoxyribonuclease V gamma subunit